MSFPAGNLRHTLSLLSNVTDLSLILPASTPHTIFRGVFLVHLVLLNTTLPHKTIADFVERHSTLRILVLGRCGRSKQCALQDIDLSSITEIECDSRCVESLQLKDMTVTTARVNITNTPPSPLSTVLRNVHFQPILTTLSLQVPSDDYNILGAIGDFAPALRNLKLIDVRNPLVSLNFHHRRRGIHAQVLCSDPVFIIAAHGMITRRGQVTSRDCRTLKFWFVRPLRHL